MTETTETTEQREQRCQKLKRLKLKGIKPYQNLFKPTHQAEEIRDKFDEKKESQVKIAGRIRSWRAHGKATFAHLEDFSGRLQVYFNNNKAGSNNKGGRRPFSFGKCPKGHPGWGDPRPFCALLLPANLKKHHH